ncbi:hypothetical protein EVG20_g6532, partial [Dentipellis fragilis]
MAHQSRPEPMNASPHHPKVKTSLTFSDPYYLAGSAITGKIEVESRADKGLGLGIIMVELFAIEVSKELTSRDHSATSTFIHARRLFQGQGLPPSNAVLPHPVQDYPALPAHYYQAQRGSATFLFKLPLPSSSPNSIDFGQGLARVRYEVRATVGVSWKGENRLVVDTREVDVLESYELDFDRIEPEGVVVGEHGKIWVQAKVVGGLVVAGESACVELQVKNHSTKKTTGLSVTLERHLQLCGLPPNQKAPLQISDTLTTVKFRGPEYIAYPGVEGVAQLVFDVPRSARTVKAGDREGDDTAVRPKPPVFEVRCLVKVTMSLPIGSKDIQLDLPPFGSPVYDPSFYPFGQSSPPGQAQSPIPFDRAQSPYAYPFTPPPVPVSQPYYDPSQQQWYAPSPAQSPYPYYSPPAPVFSPPLPGCGTRRVISIAYHTVRTPALRSTAPTTTPHHLLQHHRERHRCLDHRGRRRQHQGSAGRQRRARIPRLAPPTHVLPPPLRLAHLAPLRRTRDSHPHPTHLPLAATQPGSALPAPAALTNARADDRPVLRSRARALAPQERPRGGAGAHGGGRRRRLSHDIPKRSDAGLEKTLPKPPVPSGKVRLLGPQRPRADGLFAQDDTHADADADVIEDAPIQACPKTPTLSALSMLKPARGVGAVAVANMLSVPVPTSTSTAQEDEESGLDALERRLLAEVGTRKLDTAPRRPDARAAVLPIAIPSAQEDVGGELNDSA